MDQLLVKSDGFPVGSLHIPAFQLRAGECICLHFPEPVVSVEVEQLVGVLTGKISLPGVQLFGRFRWAAPLCKHRYGLAGLFRPMRVADWLSRIAGAAPAQAQIILQKLHPLERDNLIGRLPGTPKTLLSIEAAWLAGADVVIFTTAGLDPLGREAVYQAVASHFLQGSAIHLSFPYRQNERWGRQCFAGTTCLELKRSTEPLVSVMIPPRTR